MYDILSLVGLVLAIAGVGLLLVLLIALINNQLPINFFGAFLAIAPFICLFLAAALLTRQKK